MKKFCSLFVITLLGLVLFGCSKNNSNTIQTCIISNTKAESIDDVEDMTQPESLSAGQEVYANVHVIESPKEMEYTAVWYLDGTEIKRTSEKTDHDRQDFIGYELEAENAVCGTLTCEIVYNDTVLFTKELTIR